MWKRELKRDFDYSRRGHAAGRVLRQGLRRLVTHAGELDLSFVGCLYLSSPSKVNFLYILMKENALAVKSQMKKMNFKKDLQVYIAVKY